MVRWIDKQIVEDRALEHAATVLGPCSDAAAALAELRRRRQLGRDPICRLQGTRYRLEDRQPGPDAGPAIACWRLTRVEDRLGQLRTDVLVDAAPALRRLADNDPFEIEAGIRTRHGNVLAAYEVGRHQDLQYPRWSLQLCLSAGWAHGICCDRKSYPVRQGRLVLLDVHQVHSLTWTGKLPGETRGRRGPYVALTWDLDQRPDVPAMMRLIEPLFPDGGPIARPADRGGPGPVGGLEHGGVAL